MEQADPANNIFLVEKLLDRRWRKNRAEYLVKWLGYPETETTWEPRANINPVLVEQFDADHGGPLTTPSPRGAKRKIAQPASSSAASSSTSQRGRPRAPPKTREENPPNRSRRRRQDETGSSEQDLMTGSSNADETETNEEPQMKKSRASEVEPAAKTDFSKIEDNGTPAEKSSALTETVTDQPTFAANEGKSSTPMPDEGSAPAIEVAAPEQKREIPTINVPSDDDDCAIIGMTESTETTVIQDAAGGSSIITTKKTVTETIEEDDDCQVIFEEQPASSNNKSAASVVEEPSVLNEPMDSTTSDAARSASVDQVAPISVPQIVEIKETTIASSTVTFSGDQPESNGEHSSSVVETRHTIELIEPTALPEESVSTFDL